MSSTYTFKSAEFTEEHRIILYHGKLNLSCIVGCQGVVQLGAPVPGFAWGGPAKVGAC